MSFLAPAAAWLLLAFVPLLWLWRFQRTRRTVTIPSLAPFRHLREQMPTAQLIRVNVLLLLQALLLLALIAALARPQLHAPWLSRPHRRLVAIVDNSASMRAASLGSTAYVRARGTALRLVGSAAPDDRVLVVSTAPPALVTPRWTDAAEARAAVYQIQPTDAPGDLAGAIQLAQSLAGGGVHKMVVATDEPAPHATIPPHVEWATVGRAQPNVALLRFELSHELADSMPLTATVEAANFSADAQDVTVELLHGARSVAVQKTRLGAGERRAVSLGPITLAGAESLTATVRAGRDALTADNTNIIARHGRAHVAWRLDDNVPAPVRRVFERLARQSADAPLTDSSPRLTYAVPGKPPEAPTCYVWPLGPKRETRPMRIVDWDATHAVSRFLNNLDQLPVTVPREVAWPEWARPVVWGSDGRTSVPLVGIGQRRGVREVVVALGVESVDFDDPRAVELVILLLNIQQWLAPGNLALRVATGETLSMPVAPAGEIAVTLPMGEARRIKHAGGAWEFTETRWAGSYRVTAPNGRWEFHAALADAREMNLIEPLSSIPGGLWPEAAPASTERPAPRPVARWCWWMAFAVFVLEWLLYQQRVARREAQTA